MKNCFFTFSTWILCLLAVCFHTTLNAQNVRDGFCDYAVTLTCGVATTNQTTVGGSSIISSYPQCNGYTFAGPERVYKVVTTNTGNLQVDLTIHANYLDLDILLLSDNCVTPTCLAQSITSNANGRTEQIIFNNAPAGTYYVIVDSEKDVGAFDLLVSCSNQTSTCDLAYTATPSSIGCGNTSGSIALNITQGKGPFKIDWDNSSNTIWNTTTISSNQYTITGLPAGTYNVRIEDLSTANCIVTKSNITVSNTGSLNAAFSATDAPCGSNFGFINIDVANSPPPYWVSVKGPKSGTVQGNSNNIVIKNMPPGQYEVTVEKDNCTKTGWVTIGEDPDLDFDAEVTDADCGKAGSFWVTVKNGSPTYTIEWWHKDGTSSWLQSANNNFVIDGMKSGEYTIKVTDRNGCWKSKKMNVGGGKDLDFELEANASSCDSKGAIWVTVKNGSPQYVVEWWGPNVSKWGTTNNNSFQLKDLGTGEYTVKITDKSGCTDTKKIYIDDNGKDLDIQLEAQGATCDESGSIWVTLKNGKPNFSVDVIGDNGITKWFATALNSFKVGDLPVGYYEVVITDANGCKGIEHIRITDEGGKLDYAINTSSAGCAKDGAIQVNIQDGTPTYFVELWGPNNAYFSAQTNSGSFSLKELTAGDYTLKITDKKGCADTKYVKVEGGDSGIWLDLEANNATCKADGRIWVTIKEGYGPYHLSWEGPVWGDVNTSSTGYQINDLEPGSYTVSVKDSYGCTYSEVIIIYGGTSNLVLELESNNANCYRNGNAWVTVKNGKAPYTIAWSGPSAGTRTEQTGSFQLENLYAGQYSLSVEDAYGCTITDVLVIKEDHDQVDFSLEAYHGTCGEKGSIDVSIYKGESPYYIYWEGPVDGEASTSSSNFKINNLPTGRYDIEIRDKNGCTTKKQIYIETGADLSTSVSQTEGECGGNGQIWVNIAGGKTPYEITISGAMVGSTTTYDDQYHFANVPQGDYYITVEDASGCSVTKEIEVTGKSGNLEITAEVNDASCESKGSAWLSISGGKPNYTIHWEGPVAGSATVSSASFQLKELPAGYYVVYVEDFKGCEDKIEFTIDDNGGKITVDLSTSASVACEHDGRVYVNISGGTAPYTISYEGPTNGQVTTTDDFYEIIGLDPGSYVFYITDSKGCATSDKITVFDNGSDLSLDLTPTDAECGIGGSIKVDIFGGIPNYEITYVGPGIENKITTSNSSFLITDLVPGEYLITVVDAIGCVENFSTDIFSEGGNISIQLVPKNDICGQGGSIEVRMHDGSPDYAIEWSGPTSGSGTSSSSTFQIGNLEPGNYAITVTDANGCEGKDWVAVNTGGEVTFNLNADEATCQEDGSILVNITSGSPSYDISWIGPLSGSQSINTNVYRIDNLIAGRYEITVKDAKGCDQTELIDVISDKSDLNLTLTNVNTNCGSKGSITASVTGGQSNYTFSWGGPVSGSIQTSSNTYTIDNLPSGSYTISVFDGKNCSTSKSIQIKDTDSNLSLTAIGTDAACDQPSSIQVTVANGVPNFLIEWTGPVDGSITTASNSHTITDLQDGEYIVRVTDANGCTKAQVVIIKSTGTEIDFSFQTQAASCGEKGAISLSIIDGNGPFQVSWTGPSSGTTTSAESLVQITNLVAGRYSVTVRDKNGCSVTQLIDINETNGVNDSDVNFASKAGDVTCNGPGSILVTMITGVGPFSVSWDGPVSGSRTFEGTDFRIEDLPEGIYDVTVTSISGCGSRTQSIEVGNRQAVLGVNGTISNGVCGDKGSVMLSWTGGTDPFTISWTGPSTGTFAVNGLTHTVTDLLTGTYTFTVKGFEGCEGQFQATINNEGTDANADFTFTIDGKTLTFNNKSTAGVYGWNFGDGNISNETSPTHTYAENGTYTICLLVTNDCGVDEHCESVTINTLEGGAESASILLTEQSGPKGTVLQLPVRVLNCQRLATLSGTIMMGNENVAKINGISPNAISPVYNDANHSFSYLASGLGMNISSETILFYINVELVGNIGQSSSIDLSSLPVALELTCTEDGFSEPITPGVGSGRVSISAQEQMTVVKGDIKTYWGDGIAETMVAIRGSGHESNPMTSLAGEYSAEELPMGYEYTFKPYKNSNPSNGLSTYGLFITQKYILGYQPELIQSPYQVIAMDANCSGTLTTYDLFLMQQMLVGNISEFPNCNSWVFVDADYEFPADFNDKNVFPYADYHTMMLDEAAAVVDFIGIKVGDVLGRAIPNDTYRPAIAEDRNQSVIPLAVNAVKAERGALVTLDFRAEDFESVLSFQLGLDFDTEALEFVEFVANDRNALASTIAGNVRNQLKISWYHTEGKALTVAPTETLFTLKFVAKEKIDDIMQIININSRTFTSELHKQSHQTYRFKLKTANPLTESPFKVYQNTPNPFLDATIITIEMPLTQAAQLILHDQFGRLVQTFNYNLEKGINNIELQRNDLAAGIYYYTVKTGELADTKRLLVIER